MFVMQPIKFARDCNKSHVFGSFLSFDVVSLNKNYSSSFILTAISLVSRLKKHFRHQPFKLFEREKRKCGIMGSVPTGDTYSEQLLLCVKKLEKLVSGIRFTQCCFQNALDRHTLHPNRSSRSTAGDNANYKSESFLVYFCDFVLYFSV